MFIYFYPFMVAVIADDWYDWLWAFLIVGIHCYYENKNNPYALYA